MGKRKSQVSTHTTTCATPSAGKKSPDSIGRRKFFKLGVGMGVAALPYVVPVISTIMVPTNALACHMGSPPEPHGMGTCP